MTTYTYDPADWLNWPTDAGLALVKVPLASGGVLMGGAAESVRLILPARRRRPTIIVRLDRRKRPRIVSPLEEWERERALTAIHDTQHDTHLSPDDLARALAEDEELLLGLWD